MPDERLTGAERIAASLRARILAGDFRAGAPLREEELASHYGVSRHAIREVLRRVVAEGIAEYSSFRGARIPSLSAADVVDIYRARKLIECESLRCSPDLQVQKVAAMHSSFVTAVSSEDWNTAFEVDLQFHSYFVATSGSNRLSEWHRRLMLSLKVAHLSAPEFQSRGLRESVPQHAAIVRALAAGDTRGASTALERHLHYSECLLLEGLGVSAPQDR